MSAVRLIVIEEQEGLREMLEGPYYGLFGSVVLPNTMDASAFEDLVEIAEQKLPFELDPFQSVTEIEAACSLADPDQPTMLPREIAKDPLALAIQLFVPGIPCVELSQLSQAAIELIEFRSSHPAFAGQFHLREGLSVEWELGIEFARLTLDLARRRGTITHSSPDGKEVFALPTNDLPNK